MPNTAATDRRALSTVARNTMHLAERWSREGQKIEPELLYGAVKDARPSNRRPIAPIQLGAGLTLTFDPRTAPYREAPLSCERTRTPARNWLSCATLAEVLVCSHNERLLRTHAS